MRYMWIVSLLLIIGLFFQNCSVYKSQGLTNFEKNLGSGGGVITCYPYIDQNDLTYEILGTNPLQYQVATAVSTTTNGSVQCSFSVVDSQGNAVSALPGAITCTISAQNAANAISAATSMTTAGCDGDGGSSSPTCIGAFQAIYPTYGQSTATFVQFVPQPNPDPYNQSNIVTAIPAKAFVSAGPIPYSFALVYSTNDNGTVDYGMQYFATEQGAPFGASCIVQANSTPVTGSSPFFILLNEITEEMAHNANHLQQ